MLIANLLVIGLLAGAVYALVGIGFTLVIGVSKVVNFAHGAFVALGMFFALALHDVWGISPYVSLVPGLVLFLAIGFGMAGVFRSRAAAAGEVGQLIIGLGALLLIESGIALAFGTSPRRLNLALPDVSVFGSAISVTRIAAFGVAILLGIGVKVLVDRTWLGRAMQAVAIDSDAAALQGVQVRIVQSWSVALSIALAGVAGIMISPFVVLTPFVGTEYLLVAFAVVVVGGIGSSTGAAVAGMLIGVLQALSNGFLSSAYASLVPLVLVLLILSVRPSRIGATA